MTTQGLIGIQPRPQLTSNSDITASSQFGTSGTIALNTPTVTPDTGLLTLSTDVLDQSNQVASGCQSEGDSSFIMTGRGGIPANPIEQLALPNSWSDLRAYNLTQPRTAKPINQFSALTEATAWGLNSQGQPELVGSIAPMQRSVSTATCAN